MTLILVDIALTDRLADQDQRASVSALIPSTARVPSAEVATRRTLDGVPRGPALLPLLPLLSGNIDERRGAQW